MNLVKLEPQFVKFTAPGQHSDVDNLHEASGIIFLCPKCYIANGGPVGTHSILVWFKDRGVPDAEEPTGRWAISGGTGYANLSLAPSIRITEGCQWHGYLTNGQIR